MVMEGDGDGGGGGDCDGGGLVVPQVAVYS